MWNEELPVKEATRVGRHEICEMVQDGSERLVKHVNMSV